MRACMMGLLLTSLHASSRLASPQCSSIPLRSISLTGFALCEWPYAAPLTCQHDVATTYAPPRTFASCYSAVQLDSASLHLAHGLRPM